MIQLDTLGTVLKGSDSGRVYYESASLGGAFQYIKLNFFVRNWQIQYITVTTVF